MNILGLIPARGGSKGILHKNRKLLAGKPLLQYTIDAALGATELDAVVFSSEDDTLIELAERSGVRVPFKRPKELATDTAKSIDVVLHALGALSEKGEHYDAVCLLQVTTPFRTAADIDAALQKFKLSNVDSLITVLEVPHKYNPHWVFEAENETLRIATGEQEIISRRQELPPAYIRDGAIYITKTEVLRDKKSFFGTRLGYLLSDDSKHVNIDTMEDWGRAERILSGESLE
ncbi:cytidylyltransferase domain-containing protein [Jejudonia soesokkakensis]|uniref:Cytidylyltransferase domain-containing protein n=1 Tax=Jejudonia soesokkakensis TaxID=1323432 RepID=A0ABW2MPQ5_9FLAO